MLKKMILMLGLSLLMVSFGTAMASETDPGEGILAEYTYCYTSQGGITTFYLDYDGQFITGIVSDSCGTSTPLLGDVVNGSFVFYRDYATGICGVEGVWYTGNLGNMTYEWINTAGGSGTGQMVPCP